MVENQAVTTDFDSLAMELETLRHADLQPEYTFSFASNTYSAKLETAPTALCPMYGTYGADGSRIGQVVLPSNVENVEFFFFEFFLGLDTRSFLHF